MIIDLDSWEAGYADGRLGRASQCPTRFDTLSYCNGYCEGRAMRSGELKAAPRARYVPSSIQRRLQLGRRSGNAG